MRHSQGWQLYYAAVDAQRNAMESICKNEIVKAKTGLGSLNVPALQKSLSSNNNAILHALRMMQIGIAHVQRDHRYVNKWVLKIVSNLHDASVFSEYRTWIVLLKVMQFFHPGNHQNPTTDDADKWLKELELLYGRGIRELVTKGLSTLEQRNSPSPTVNRKSNRKSKKKRKKRNKSSNNNGTAPHQHKRLKKGGY